MIVFAAPVALIAYLLTGLVRDDGNPLIGSGDTSQVSAGWVVLLIALLAITVGVLLIFGRTSACVVAWAAAVVPLLMFALAIRFDFSFGGCHWEWSERQKTTYDALMLSTPFVVAALTSGAVLLESRRRAYALAAGIGIGAFAVAFVLMLGVAALDIGCE